MPFRYGGLKPKIWLNSYPFTSWRRIKPSGAKGVTAQESEQDKSRRARERMSFVAGARIFGTGGNESAGARQPGRNARLVRPNEKQRRAVDAARHIASRSFRVPPAMPRPTIY